MKLDEENGKYLVPAKGRDQKVHRFSRNEFWKNIGCLISDNIFGLWG